MAPQFGPSTFENIEELLRFLNESVLKDKNHPLRKAIDDHIHAQTITQKHPLIAHLTKNTKQNLTRVFEGSELADTPQEYLANCFWDPSKKYIGNVGAALQNPEIETNYTEKTDDPRKKTHFMAITVLRTHLYYYNKYFHDTNKPTNEAFSNALSYLKDTVLPEMERLFGERFLEKTPNTPEDAAERFRSAWKVAALQAINWAPKESEARERPSLTGRPRLTYPNAYGYDGFLPTLEALDLH